MRVRTAEEFVADVRNRCNMEFSELLTDAEIIEIANQEITELRGALRLNEGQPHEVLRKTYSVTSDSALYTLPTDFWELLSIKVTIGGRPRMLDPFMENERADLEAGPFLATVTSPMYRLQGNQIEFLPVNQAFTAEMRYAPRSGRMRLGQVPPDSFDGYNGYEVAVIYGTCAVCKEKELVDPSFYEGRKQRIMVQIKALAAQRDAGKPERVTDVTGALDDPYGFYR
jgi:hypothetical protein